MTRVGAVALNTFREAIRDKILYVLLFFAVGILMSTRAVAQGALHEELRVTRDIGLVGIELFGSLIAIFVGVTLVYKELDKKTVFSLIPKPMHRWEFILGKFFGMVITLAVLVAVMAAVLFAVLSLERMATDDYSGFGPVLRAIVLIYCEIVVVTSVAVLFSTFTTPLLSGAFTLGIFVVGHFTPELREVIGKLASPARGIMRAAIRVFPDLNLFYVSGEMVRGQPVSVHGAYVDWSYVAVAAGYGACYAACALALSMLLFSRRDFV
jgi:ABC-type transport system involved in multi-copper enzyme maturation permease subunit